MRFLLVALLIIGCSHKEDKLAEARRSADEARAAATKAEAAADDAKAKLAQAQAEQQAALASKLAVEAELAEAKKQTQEMLVLANKKLAELKAERASATPARQKEIDKQVADLTAALADVK